MVAAVGVGHVTASYDPEVATHRPEFFRAALRHRQYDEPKPIRRGDELGIFHLGSTTIVVFEPGRVELDALAAGASDEDGRRHRSGGVNDRESPRLKPGVEGPRRLLARIERPHAWGCEGRRRRRDEGRPTARRRGGSDRPGRASAAARSASARGDFSTPLVRKRTTTQPRGIPVVGGTAPAPSLDEPVTRRAGRPTSAEFEISRRPRRSRRRRPSSARCRRPRSRRSRSRCRRGRRRRPCRATTIPSRAARRRASTSTPRRPRWPPRRPRSGRSIRAR